MQLETRKEWGRGLKKKVVLENMLTKWWSNGAGRSSRGAKKRCN